MLIPFFLQGVVMEVSLLDPPVLTELTSKEATASLHRKNALWIALDEIQDPQNMGAIIRTCVYFGIDGIITTEVKSAPLNSTVSKASAGALEIAPIFYPGNLGQFLENSKENGWRVIGTSLEEHSKSADSTSLQMDKPTILVLGNEAKGLRHRIKSLCDYHVKLEPVGSAGEVESLNVSVATALLVHPMATCPSNKKGGFL
jgi:21S rRNA (GM2251-2'-O)-methyltransferase